MVTGDPSLKLGFAVEVQVKSVAVEECQMPSQYVTPPRRLRATVAALSPGGNGPGRCCDRRSAHQSDSRHPG